MFLLKCPGLKEGDIILNITEHVKKISLEGFWKNY
jgi:hypothetical protein